MSRAGLMWLCSVKMQNRRIILLLKFMSLVGLYIFFFSAARRISMLGSQTGLLKRGGVCKIQLVDEALGPEHEAVFCTTGFCQHSHAGREWEEV